MNQNVYISSFRNIIVYNINTFICKLRDICIADLILTGQWAADIKYVESAYATCSKIKK